MEKRVIKVRQRRSPIRALSYLYKIKVLLRENIFNFFTQYLSTLPPTAIGVEIGVRRGELSQHILQSFDGKLVCVDYWDEQPPGQYKEFGNDKTLQQEHFDEYITRTRQFENRRLTVCNLSTIAALFFPDNYFDFVFIDANHEYDAVSEDLAAWWPKVKKGGLFSGDDFIYNFKPDDGKNMTVYWNEHYCGQFGVNTALDEFLLDKTYEVSFIDHPRDFNMWYLYK